MTLAGSDDETGVVTEGSLEGIHERLIESATSHAVFMLTEEGRIATWPTMAETLYGYGESTVRGRELSYLFADQKGAAAALEDLLGDATDVGVETQHWHERNDGTVFWATITVSPVRNGEFHGYTVVSKDTTSQKQYERMLERQNDRLKEFTDILSHDLRSPLAVIAGRLELVETDDTEHVDVIRETVERMGRLIEDLLRVARQGGVVERPEPTDLGEVIRVAWEGPDDGSATLEYDPVPTITADGDRLCEMFENLFRNSVEHGSTSSRLLADDAVEHDRSDDGTVSIRVGPLDDGFYVEDDGPGVADEIRTSVFDHGFTTAVDGSGFGLSVVRTIVGAHGWDIEVVGSESGGARFEVTGIEFVCRDE